MMSAPRSRKITRKEKETRVTLRALKIFFTRRSFRFAVRLKT